MAIQENTLINAAIRAELLSANQLPDIKSQARRSGLSTLEFICLEGRFPLTTLYHALAENRKLPYLERDDIYVNPDQLNAFNAQILLRKLFIPAQYQGNLVLVTSDPDDKSLLEITKRTLNQPATLAMADPLMIEAILRTHFQLYESNINAIAVFNDIMKAAYLQQATDLHFESLENSMQIRMRVDGRLQHYECPLGKTLAEALMSRIKVLSGMDIAEQFMAQDGSFAYNIDGWPELDAIEMRVATIPTRFGERATLRILGQNTANLSLAQLGVPPHLLQPMLKAIHKPYGIVLVTGPTGSGKSTTLYASLRELNAARLNIMTAEDPIEQVVTGISQVQVSEKVSFSKALRSFLRHDPDVMLVGEIRDGETAQTALRAAMTGHLVLSTLHTNNAVSAVSRMVDIGCPPYLIASTLIGVLAQRLLRRICSHCKTDYPANSDEKQFLNTEEENLTLYRGTGCARCSGTGYSGRVGVYETLWVDKQMEHLIHEKASDEALKNHARETGLLNTLWEDSRQKVLEGTTSLQEALLLYEID